jgi:uncharacterized iron-regulated membrane protein
VIKRWIRRIHMLLGLAAGLIMVVVGATGALFAFENEIRDLTEPHRFATESGAPLPPSRILAAAEKAVPGKYPTGVSYPGPERSATVEFYRTENGERAHWLIAYLEPSTGRVIKVTDRLGGFDFFQFVINGHTRLWLPDAIGREIVGHATFVFVLLLASGIILWWPRHRAALRQRLAVKWKAGLRRRLFDLHSVPGFYASLAALLIALTGLAWSYEWFADVAYRTASGGKAMTPWSEAVSDTTTRLLTTRDAALDSVCRQVSVENRPVSLELRLPESPSAAVQVYANPDEGVYYRGDFRYFDRNSLKEIQVRHPWGRYAEATFADRLQRMYYDIHIGAILGLPGKLIAFLAAVVAASLPVTGFLMWWKRRSRPKGGKRPGGESTHGGLKQPKPLP